MRHPATTAPRAGSPASSTRAPPRCPHYGPAKRCPAAAPSSWTASASPPARSNGRGYRCGSAPTAPTAPPSNAPHATTGSFRWVWTSTGSPASPTRSGRSGAAWRSSTSRWPPVATAIWTACRPRAPPGRYGNSGRATPRRRCYKPSNGASPITRTAEEAGVHIHRGNIVFTPTPRGFVTLMSGHVVVDDGGLVVECVSDLPERYAGVPVTDHGDRLVLPGFTDAHVHACQLPITGLQGSTELIDWLHTLTFPQEADLGDSDYAA